MSLRMMPGVLGAGTWMVMVCSSGCSTKKVRRLRRHSRKKPLTVTVSTPSGVWAVSEYSTFCTIPVSGRASA